MTTVVARIQVAALILKLNFDFWHATMSVDLAVALRSSSTTMAYSLLIILLLLLVLVLLVVLMVSVTGVLGMVAALAIAPMQVHTIRPFVI